MLLIVSVVLCYSKLKDLLMMNNLYSDNNYLIKLLNSSAHVDKNTILLD